MKNYFKCRSTFILIAIFIIVLVYAMANITPNGHSIEGIDREQEISVLPFQTGEKFTYEVRHSGMKIGESVLTFHGEGDLGDKKIYYVTFSTSLPTFKDAEELYADKNSFLPVEVHRSIKKRIGFDDRIMERYDQESFRVDISQKSKLRSKTFSINKASPIHNAILLTYYYRSLKDFIPGERFKIALPTVDFEVIFKGIETIDTPCGEYSAYAFTSEPPRFKLWLSTDERRIPLKIENPGTLGYSLVIEAIE
jgi:hypothetical protein